MIRYDTRAEWGTAAGPHVVDGLEAYGVQRTTGGSLELGAFDFYVEFNHQSIGTCGQTSTPFSCNLQPSSSTNIILEGDVHADWDPDGGPNELRFHAPILAFGVDVLAIEDEEFGEALQLTIGAEQFRVSSGFFGVVSDVPFATVLIEGPRLVYVLDDVSYSAIPEPSGALLFTAGVLVLAGFLTTRVVS